MKIILVPLLIALNACAINRAPSLNLLERRADFDGMHGIEASLNAVDNPLLVPVRTEPVVADIWVHPHELPNGDYFRGAWVRTVVTRSSWKMDEKVNPLVIREGKNKKSEQKK
jgi:hypothetical protein